MVYGQKNLKGHSVCLLPDWSQSFVKGNGYVISTSEYNIFTFCSVNASYKYKNRSMSEAPWSFWIFLLNLPCCLLCRFTATAAAFSASKLRLSVPVSNTESDNRLWTYSTWCDSHTAQQTTRTKGNFNFLQHCLLTIHASVQITAYICYTSYLVVNLCQKQCCHTLFCLPEMAL